GTTSRSTNSSRPRRCSAASKSTCGWSTATGGARPPTGHGYGACWPRPFSLGRRLTSAVQTRTHAKLVLERGQGRVVVGLLRDLGHQLGVRDVAVGADHHDR